MATEPPAELWKLWKQEQLTTEMAVGYLIQNQVEQEQAITAAKEAQADFRRELDHVAAQNKAQQKMLEALQQAVAKLQNVVDGLVRSSQKAIRKDAPKADTQN